MQKPEEEVEGCGGSRFSQVLTFCTLELTAGVNSSPPPPFCHEKEEVHGALPLSEDPETLMVAWGKGQRVTFSSSVTTGKVKRTCSRKQL